jgi:hypothetical protein
VLIVAHVTSGCELDRRHRGVRIRWPLNGTAPSARTGASYTSPSERPCPRHVFATSYKYSTTIPATRTTPLTGMTVRNALQRTVYCRPSWLKLGDVLFMDLIAAPEPFRVTAM